MQMRQRFGQCEAPLTFLHGAREDQCGDLEGGNGLIHMRQNISEAFAVVLAQLGKARPQSERRKVDNAHWPEMVDAQADTFDGETLLGPLG